MGGWNSQNVTNLLIIDAAGGFNGLFVYAPAPGAGNLIASIAAASGTDPFGNPYVAGITEYQGAQKIQLFNTGGVLFQNFLTGSVNEASPAQLKAGVVGGVFQFIMGAPTAVGSTDGPFINLTSTFGTPNFGKGFLSYQKPGPGPDQNLLSWGADGVFRASMANLVGGIPLVDQDFFTRTITTVGAQALTTSYPIPANDAQTGSNQNTTYYIRAAGTGVQAAPAVTGVFTISMFGSNVFTSSAITPAAAGHNFAWFIDISVMMSGNSATAGFLNQGLVVFEDLTTGATVTAPMANTGTVNNTAAGNMLMNWNWGSVVGGPSISCPGSTFRREGA